MLQSHHVVDPQPAGVTHIGADQIDEAAVACRAARARWNGGKPQSWPTGLQISGGAPTLAPDTTAAAFSPCLGAGTVRSDREVAVKPHRHACSAQPPRLHRLLVSEPLRPGQEFQRPVRRLNSATADDAGVAKRIGPGVPIGATRDLRERNAPATPETGNSVQVPRPVAPECLERAPARMFGRRAADIEQSL